MLDALDWTASLEWPRARRVEARCTTWPFALVAAVMLASPPAVADTAKPRQRSISWAERMKAATQTFADRVARAAELVTSSPRRTLVREPEVEVVVPVVREQAAAKPGQPPRLIVHGGIGTLGATGAFGRITVRFGARTSIRLDTHYALSDAPAMIDSPQYLIELGLERRIGLGRAKHGLRVGALFRDYAPGFDAGMANVYTRSQVLAVFAGYGVAIESRWVRTFATVDVVGAPLVTKFNYFTDDGSTTSHVDNSSSYVGGRVGLTTQVGWWRLGLGLDAAAGFLPGLDAQLYVLLTAAVYVGF